MNFVLSLSKKDFHVMFVNFAIAFQTTYQHVLLCVHYIPGSLTNARCGTVNFLPPLILLFKRAILYKISNPVIKSLTGPGTAPGTATVMLLISCKDQSVGCM